jgi:hypothetical protein
MNKFYLAELVQWLKKNELTVIQEMPMKKVFATKRRFRYDYYIPEIGTAIEINGGHWVNGRHNRGKGYENDLVKLNLSQVNGVTVLQYTYQQLKEQKYKNDIEKLKREYVCETYKRPLALYTSKKKN